MIGIKHETYWRACVTVANPDFGEKEERYAYSDRYLAPWTTDAERAHHFETRDEAEHAARRVAASTSAWDTVMAAEVELVKREITGYSLPLEEVTK